MKWKGSKKCKESTLTWLECEGAPDFPILVHYLKYCSMGTMGKRDRWNKAQNPHTQKTRKENLLWLALGQIKQIKENHLAIPRPFSQLRNSKLTLSLSFLTLLHQNHKRPRILLIFWFYIHSSSALGVTPFFFCLPPLFFPWIHQNIKFEILNSIYVFSKI